MSRASRWAAAAYLVLLIASHSPECRRSGAVPHSFVQTVKAVDRGKLLTKAIHLAYKDSAPASAEEPVVLIHGSPGSSEVLKDLSALLSPKFRVIVPDLPGFGGSTRDLPDYSFRAHARYVLELLDALHVPRARLVGYSMGGGVALNVADIAPARVESIVMLSAIGLQEYELTGSYTLNHSLHGAQLAILWLLYNAVPHFGLLRRSTLSVEYARNFYDSDQRPLRSILKAYRGPMLLIHGNRDHNVPIAAAWAHHALVPQSEMLEIEGDHFVAFMRPNVFLDPLIDFLNRN
jgi:pimeloyl-ACP methyl ester carboxylesterase